LGPSLKRTIAVQSTDALFTKLTFFLVGPGHLRGGSLKKVMDRDMSNEGESGKGYPDRSLEHMHLMFTKKMDIIAEGKRMGGEKA